MGYVLFAALKQMKNYEISKYTREITEIMNTKANMVTFTGHIYDGDVSADDLASDPMNFNNYVEFIEGRDAFRSSDQGGSDVISQAQDLARQQGYKDEDIPILIEKLNKQIDMEYARRRAQELSANEVILDNKKKLLETKLTEAQNELKAIEEAEGRAIAAATPKYNGLQG